MHISSDGLRLIEEFEGFSSRPYWDAYGRVWTRGYGETEGITAASPKITRATAQKRLELLVESRYEPAIRALGVELNQNQWDALCSFAWNLGAGIFTGSLRQALEKREWHHAGQLMLAYDHAGGQVLAGLERRRQLEVALFLRGPAPYIPAREIRWATEFDRLRSRRGPFARARRRALERAMRKRMAEIKLLAEREANGWQKRNRANRYHALLTRTRA